MLHGRLIELGKALGTQFLDGAAGVALAQEAARAAGVLQLAVQVDDPVLADLPWETLVLPGQNEPLALQDGVQMLDYEAELARILAAVDPTRRGQDAYVQVLNWGAPAAIRDALAAERFHVLHISCHATPGALVLESDTGEADLVTAPRFVREVLVPDQVVPLVVLAGCSTALADRESPSASRMILRGNGCWQAHRCRCIGGPTECSRYRIGQRQPRRWGA